jgi:hypothetical protein
LTHADHWRAFNRFLLESTLKLCVTKRLRKHAVDWNDSSSHRSFLRHLQGVVAEFFSKCQKKSWQFIFTLCVPLKGFSISSTFSFFLSFPPRKRFLEFMKQQESTQKKCDKLCVIWRPRYCCCCCWRFWFLKEFRKGANSKKKSNL